MSTPAVVISAPASGSGKTTIATGLMGALRRAGRRVAAFKVGPDFIDPGYHALATGRSGRNLDPVLVGDELVGSLYRHGSDDADIAVVEGVMGLFDGRIGPAAHIGSAAAPGCTAQVAALLGAPVILVVDARGQSHSVAALLHGFATFDPSVRLAGVILNRVGSARHDEVLRQACAQVGLAVLGSIPRADELAVPSRHLGLITAVEHGVRAGAAVEAMTSLVARHVDLDAVAAVATTRVTEAAWAPEPSAPLDAPVTVALAAGKAFSFGYAEHAELLRAAGARVVDFDPLADPLPADTAALVLPGGFAEQFGAELAANDLVRGQIAALAQRGAPIHAECAGLTYLVDDLDGQPMCGVLPGSASFSDTLTLGYRDAVAVAESPLHAPGDRVVGHEFHRTVVRFVGDRRPAWRYRGRAGQAVEDGAVQRGVHAGYLHTHPAAHPEAIGRFVAAAATSRLAE
ncbi:MAG: cobyrinate a,c-diamide synthase [Mycolicibacterium sp.]|uniref:cobyrinate a,c-diamide synthase n=1 Tax=Mycolicibacterium sp. TaxID=2320850 RepID=UPI003D0B1857